MSTAMQPNTLQHLHKHRYSQTHNHTQTHSQNTNLIKQSDLRKSYI